MRACVRATGVSADVLATCLRLGGTGSWFVALTTAVSSSDPTARAARVLSLNVVLLSILSESAAKLNKKGKNEREREKRALREERRER